MATVINRDAPYSGLSSLMALKGRMGDTELVHMSKPEVRSLEATGQLTVNPDTGLPEAFGLRNILPVALGIAGGAAGSMVGMPFLGAAVGTGLGSLGAGNSPEQSLFNAALSYGAGSLLGNLTASADPSAFAKVPATAEGVAGGGMADVAAAPERFVTPKAIDYQPGPIGEFLGKSAVSMPAGTEVSPSQVFELTGGRAGTLQPSEYFSKPSTYLPVAGAALTGGLSSAAASPSSAPPPTPTTSTVTPAPRQQLVGGQPINPPPTEQSALSRALGESPTPNYLSRYEYQPYAKGGIIYRDDGGRVQGDEYPYTPTGQYKTPMSSPVVTPEEITANKAVQAAPPTSPVTTSPAQTAAAVARILGQQIPSQSQPQQAQPQQQFQPSIYREMASRVPSYLPSYYEPSQSSSVIGLAEGGTFEGKVDGKGDGMSDHVQFDVEGNNPDMAMLSRDEYVLPADVVAMIGNGSSNAGADKIDEFVKRIRKRSFGTEKQQKKIKAAHGGLAALLS